MDREPVIVQENAREWETWPDEEIAKKGLAHWKTLVSGDVTQSEALTMGIAKIPPNEALREHRHLQEEIYLVLEGTGSVTIDGKTRPVGPGTSGFIPGNVVHSCENTGEGDLRCAYVFPRTRSRRSSTSSTNNSETHTWTLCIRLRGRDILSSSRIDLPRNGYRNARETVAV